jgi:AcrR family transcriptional regulator
MSGAPLAVKQDQGARSRAEILDAAERLMGARGYAATSISALARASGLPPSSIYWHFGSKSGLLGAVMERGAQRFFVDVVPTRMEQYEDPRERLAQLVEQCAVSMREHAQFVRLHFFLLLGGDGERSQHEVVMRVRAEATRQIGKGLRRAYRPWGEQSARRIAEEMTDTAQALFDGMFLAAETGATAGMLVEHIEDTLHDIAERVRARSGAAPRGVDAGAQGTLQVGMGELVPHAAHPRRDDSPTT